MELFYLGGSVGLVIGTCIGILFMGVMWTASNQFKIHRKGDK